jgi:quercetin dioxygenase-like cupin family protein
MFKASRANTPEDPDVPTRPGWEGMHVWWLVDRDRGGSETALFNFSEFPPQRSHELHRHRHAEEFLYFLEGSGLHMTEDGPIRVTAGEVVFIPKNEWHGFVNDTDGPVKVVSFFSGVAKYTDAGYEVHPGTPATS